MNLPRPVATIVVARHSAVVATLSANLATGRHRLYSEAAINELLAEIHRLKTQRETRK